MKRVRQKYENSLKALAKLKELQDKKTLDSDCTNTKI